MCTYYKLDMMLTLYAHAPFCMIPQTCSDASLQGSRTTTPTASIPIVSAIGNSKDASQPQQAVQQGGGVGDSGAGMGPAVSVSCGGWHSCVVTEAGEVRERGFVYMCMCCCPGYQPRHLPPLTAPTLTSHAPTD